MKKKNVFARLQYVRYVQINIVLYSIHNYCSLLPIFVEPYFAEENRYCNSNINDFVMDFDICSIVKTSHLGKSALSMPITVKHSTFLVISGRGS